jgi:hypothetical protein
MLIKRIILNFYKITIETDEGEILVQCGRENDAPTPYLKDYRVRLVKTNTETHDINYRWRCKYSDMHLSEYSNKKGIIVDRVLDDCKDCKSSSIFSETTHCHEECRMIKLSKIIGGKITDIKYIGDSDKVKYLFFNINGEKYYIESYPKGGRYFPYRKLSIPNEHSRENE